MRPHGIVATSPLSRLPMRWRDSTNPAPRPMLPGMSGKRAPTPRETIKVRRTDTPATTPPALGSKATSGADDAGAGQDDRRRPLRRHPNPEEHEGE